MGAGLLFVLQKPPMSRESCRLCRAVDEDEHRPANISLRAELLCSMDALPYHMYIRP
jgi:hypothetical protein